ncbi:Protein OS-9 [Elasticomyces elasticus]|nr:Protein OS-9 [Elasticomyces elasticus]
MKHFWALPAALRLALASRHSFSVHDDLLAYPQYEVAFSDSYVLDTDPLISAAGFDSYAPNAESNGADISSHVPDNAANEDSRSDATSSSAHEILNLRGQPYLCSIPHVEFLDTASNTTVVSKAEEKKELMRANDRGWELLQGMQGKCIYFVSGWWSYQFCYNEGVKQFHSLPPGRGGTVYPPQEDPSVEGYVLGVYSGSASSGLNRKDKDEADARDGSLETSVGRLETKGETRYLVQRLGGGTECDLTGRERRIEVQFHCHQSTSERIHLIKEVATCAYLMVVHTPRLCNDVAFLPPQKDIPNIIPCAPIISSDQHAVASYKSRASAMSATAAAASASIAAEIMGVTGGLLPSHQKQYTVGGHIVGAKSQVGMPGRVIEKSALIGGGGGRETLVGTIAVSDGKTFKTDQAKLKELGMGGKKGVEAMEELAQQLGRLAGGKGWRLEIIENARGQKEFRGIIDSDEGTEKGKSKEKELKDAREEKTEAQADEDQGSEETFKEEL